MKINAFADVSLRAIMVLAAAPEGMLLTTQAVADAVGTPYNHVSKAMVRLRALGYIDVERGGRLGGSRLNETGRRATVGEVSGIWTVGRIQLSANPPPRTALSSMSAGCATQ